MVPTLVQLSERSYLVLKTWVDGMVNALSKCVLVRDFAQWCCGVQTEFLLVFPCSSRTGPASFSQKNSCPVCRASPSEHPVICRCQFLVGTLSRRYYARRVAQELKISPGYFSRLFKAEIGIPFKNYLIKIRMEQAKQLLRQSDHTIAEVAAAVGFPDPNYFSEAFRKYEGVSPSQYKASESKP